MKSPPSTSLERLLRLAPPPESRFALVKFGQGVANMSGKLGGTIFAHNRGGQYARNWSVPTDPASAAQLECRGAMRSLVTDWIETLTDAQREEWATYGANVPVMNRLGDPINLTGQQWYIACNTPRVRLLDPTIPRVDDGPANFDRGEYTNPTISAYVPGGPTISIAYEATDDWNNEDESAMFIFVSKPQNATVNFFKGPYLLAGWMQGNLAVPPASPKIITYPYQFAVGQRLFVRAIVSRADGRLSSEHRFSGVAA